VFPAFQSGMQHPVVTMAVRHFANRLKTDNVLDKKAKRLGEMLLVKGLLPNHRSHGPHRTLRQMR
jgi:hypothetical protein